MVMSLPFQLLHLDADHGRIRFQGRFEDRDVTWEATVVPVPASAPQYIDVGEPAGDCRPIAIGLRVARIDEAVLHKTVIMVRQYKGLRRGRYRFG